jgi:hypothetical protein
MIDVCCPILRVLPKGKWRAAYSAHEIAPQSSAFNCGGTKSSHI